MTFDFKPFLKEEERKRANPIIIRQFKKDAEERLKKFEYNKFEVKKIRDEIEYYDELLKEIENMEVSGI